MKSSDELIRLGKDDIVKKDQPLSNPRNPKQESNDYSNLIDTINQVFSLFRINYHNQFYAALPDTENLNQAKKLWLNALKNYSNDTLLKTTQQIIESSEYMPALNRFIELCDVLEFNLPTIRDAYKEACLAGTPKENINWSHPIVYYAGKKTGWFNLRNLNEKQSFPAFTEHYETLKKQVRAGETLSQPEKILIEKQESSPLDLDESKKRIKDLIASLD